MASTYTRIRLPAFNTDPTLKVPEDILQLIHKFVPWNTPKDLDTAHSVYQDTLSGQGDPNFNIGEELEKLKGLSSALKREFEICMDELGKLENEPDDLSEDLFDKLVEQLPNIQAMPGYEGLTTEDEKFMIEEALQKVGKLQVEDDPALVMHLEDLRIKLMPRNNKISELASRLGEVDRLRLRVSNFVKLLERSVEKSKVSNFVAPVPKVYDREENKDNSGRDDKKGQKLKSPIINKSQKFVEIKQKVRKDMMKLLKEVGGEALEGDDALDREDFKKMWDSACEDVWITYKCSVLKK